MPTKPDAPVAGLIAKLAAIMGEMGNVPKSGFNTAQKYAFVRESDVAERLSALLAAKNVFLHQTVLSQRMVELYQTQSGNTMYLTTVEMEFQWYDGDTGETLPPAKFVGTGADTGDKGVYKAMTGAEKYFLMKTFLVSTGDDPEADEKVDKAVAAAGAAKGARVVRGAQEGVQRGGKSSVATQAQVNEIARLAKDLELTAETIAPVIEKILGVVKPEDEDIRHWLNSLTSLDAAKVIAGLTTMAEIESVPDEPAVDMVQTGPEESEQEALSLV